MLLEVLTPDKKVFEGKVKSVTFPGDDGQFQVLDHHAPMVSALARGKMTIKGIPGSSDDEVVMINGGMVEVLHNKVVVLARSVLEQ